MSTLKQTEEIIEAAYSLKLQKQNKPRINSTSYYERWLKIYKRMQEDLDTVLRNFVIKTVEEIFDTNENQKKEEKPKNKKNKTELFE